MVLVKKGKNPSDTTPFKQDSEKDNTGTTLSFCSFAAFIITVQCSKSAKKLQANPLSKINASEGFKHN